MGMAFDVPIIYSGNLYPYNQNVVARDWCFSNLDAISNQSIEW
jgi:hypothetical protein